MRTNLKVHTSEELAAMKKPKLTLAEKQAIKLKAQRAKDAEKKARGETEPKNKARFYCTNKELQAEMIKWRDSSKIVEERTISEELGKMFLAICNKILNHSNFRNYSPKATRKILSILSKTICVFYKTYAFLSKQIIYLL